MPTLYVAENPKYSLVSRNKPNIKDYWEIKNFIELDCSNETYEASHVFVDRKNKKAYCHEIEIPIKDIWHKDNKIYCTIPDDDYYDPSMSY